MPAIPSGVRRSEEPEDLIKLLIAGTEDTRIGNTIAAERQNAAGAFRALGAKGPRLPFGTPAGFM